VLKGARTAGWVFGWTGKEASEIQSEPGTRSWPRGETGLVVPRVGSFTCKVRASGLAWASSSGGHSAAGQTLFKLKWMLPHDPLDLLTGLVGAALAFLYLENRSLVIPIVLHVLIDPRALALWMLVQKELTVDPSPPGEPGEA
jgi:hypothetical protein